MGTNQIQAGRYEDAVNFLGQATSFDPDFADAYESLGFSYHQLKNYSGSIDAWRKAIALGHNKFYTHYRLGMVYIDQMNWWAAEEAFKEALNRRVSEPEWADNYTEAHYNLGRAIVEGKGAVFEIDRLENSLKYNNIPEDRFRLAILNLWLGNSKRVQAEYKQLNQGRSVLAIELKKLMERRKKGK